MDAMTATLANFLFLVHARGLWGSFSKNFICCADFSDTIRMVARCLPYLAMLGVFAATILEERRALTVMV